MLRNNLVNLQIVDFTRYGMVNDGNIKYAEVKTYLTIAYKLFISLSSHSNR